MTDLSINSVRIMFNVSGSAGETVNRVIDAMGAKLKETIPNCNEKGSNTLTIDILQCTEGSRWGRVCCSEVGVGWVVLEVSWKLVAGKEVIPPDATPPKILCEGTKKLRDGGNLGFADLCEPKLGESTLVEDMVPRLVIKISTQVQSAMLSS